MLDPVEYRDEVVTAGLATKRVALRVDLANGELLVQRTKVEHCSCL